VHLIDPPGLEPGSRSEACGTAVDNQVGSITKSKATLFFGRVTDNARTVRISDGATRKLAKPTFRGNDRRTYVAAEVDERLPSAEVHLSDAAQRGLGRVDAAAVAE
jgi:hypothetical protein